MRRTVWMLALAAGYVDGMGLLYLGGVFCSVVTGNLVVLGVSAVQHVADTALRAGLACVVYGVTVLLARRVAPSRCLVAELLALCTLCGGWVFAHHDPRGVTQLPLLALAAIAMGLQSAATRDAEVQTTYLTGAVTRLATGRFDPLLLVPFACVPVGALSAALLLDRAPWLGPLPAVVLVAAALVAHSVPPRPPRSPTPPAADGLDPAAQPAPHHTPAHQAAPHSTARR
ncbi:YoaK family protein [Dactylosporangium sp. AC04546]|uniref:YoaK family protein n=1 Tax=Dactylosporangium sp. AC04546 TaxID=2862460 RepID=UPI002E7B14B3|nr:YoaK family protein [Dactylosporangium sp. AC04546]WVK78212.1 YoaK family protein [Dactylosporangium sp. AC04546]